MDATNNKKYNYMLEQNQKYMNTIALSFENRKVTYEELHTNIEKYAKLLYKKGIREGDVVGICALNTPESVYLLYALDTIGAVTVGFSLFDNKEKTKRNIELTKPKIIISVDMLYNNFKDYEKTLNFSTILYSPLESSNNLKLKLGYKLMQLQKGNFKLSKDSYLKYLSKHDLSLEQIQASKYIEDQLTDIMFTGGSSGVHKGVDLAGNGLNSVVEGMNRIFDAEPGMIHLGNIPFGHMVYGRVILHYALCNNMELALTLKAMPNDFYDELVRTQANAAVGGPPHWVSLIEQNGQDFVTNRKLLKDSLTNLHYATSGGEAKKETTDKAINDALHYCGSDAILGDGLGATEAWSSIMINNGKKHSPGTIGTPLSTLDIKLLNPITNEEVKQGEKGILYISGKSVMLGYHNNPKETEKVISYDEAGKKWCNIGDYVQELNNGEYKYVGREKRSFVSWVENIYPEALENIIVSMPEVREALVTPIPDEMVQYIPRYHISLYDDQIDINNFEQNLKILIESKLSENWLPGSIEYSAEPLKRMANSKIDISYYQEKDKQAFENGQINHEKAKTLRLKR